MNEFEKTHNEFLEVIYNDFGAILINRKLSKWYNLSWSEFYQEMLKQKIDCKKCLNTNWENYFQTQKSRILSLSDKNRIAPQTLNVHASAAA